MTDAETSAAIEALAHRIRERDEAMRNGGEYADAEIFAAEYLAALRAKGGWRPTAAKAGAPPLHAPAGTATKPRDETLRDLRADMEARAAAARAAKEAPLEDGSAA
jgi:hypothetical protein